jgi:drug/metabolite transporter (DMT)-like permease
LAGVTYILTLSGGPIDSLGRGALLGLLAGFFYGAYFLASQRGRSQLDVTSFFWLTAVFSTLTLLIVAFFLHMPLTGYSTATYINLILQGVLIQAGGWMLLNYAQGYLPASLVSPTLLGQPVLTALLAGPLLGESLRPGDLLGGVAVLAGILLIHSGRRRAPAKERDDR